MTEGRTENRTRRGWLIPTGLIVLSVVPVLGGAMRLAQLAGGAEVTPENARFFASPVPVVVHICAVSVYAILGAFQFVPRLRRGRWHRTAGRLLVPCGLAGAVTGLWMTLFYARPHDVGDLLSGFRLVFGSAWLLCLVLGFAAIRRRDFRRHRAWMIRGYAVGMGAVTQGLTQAPWIAAFGLLDQLSKAMLMLAGWLINIVVAEWAIRRRPARRVSPSPIPAMEGKAR
jgi:uncharacterized membrane protein